MTYDELLIEAEELGIIVKEIKMRTKKGLCIGNRIAINIDLTDSEKACVLAEELGHYHLTVGDILEQEHNLDNYKQELLARRWGYDKNIGLLGLINAFEYGCRNKFEIAEYLNVTVEYLDEALEFYKSKYGIMHQVDHYLIYFIPSLYIGKAF
ncbi:ImmA/IrrE family metallo-endopeptidase [Clostridium baratii]